VVTSIQRSGTSNRHAKTFLRLSNFRGVRALIAEVLGFRYLKFRGSPSRAETGQSQVDDAISAEDEGKVMASLGISTSGNDERCFHFYVTR